MKTHIIIPARLASTRLPEKLLRIIHGKPLLQWTYERAKQAQADSVCIAVDHPKLADIASAFTDSIVITRDNHPTGTDRLAEVVQQNHYAADDIIINLQGDEPFMPATNLHQVADNLANHADAQVSTLYETITQQDEYQDPHIVKLVTDQHGLVLYFSRATIPFHRDDTHPEDLGAKRHIGLYAYRVNFLKQYPRLSVPAIEKFEALEQLRILYHGYRIHAAEAKITTPPGIDTEKDLHFVQNLDPQQLQP